MVINVLRKTFLTLISLAAIGIMLLSACMYFSYMPMWDMMNFHYPMSSYIADCISEKTVPLWCPYSFLGSPIFADPSSGFWYPLNMLLYYLFGFNAYVLKVEYAIHLALAAIGMYKLTIYFTQHRNTAVVAAIVFPLSGFFVSSAHLFSFVYSMAWLPFVFYYYLRGCATKKYKYFIYGGICMALCVLGGYIVFAILSAYLLAAMFVYYMFTQKDNARLLFLLSALMAITAAVLCSGYLYSVVVSLPLQARADGLDIKIAMDNPFSPQSLLSFILPFSTVASTPFFGTDISMRSLYMGILALPLIYIGLKYGKRRQSYWLLAVAVFFLLASFGAYTPVRTWLYHYVPFMKMFRHPAIFRAGTAVALLLMAAQGLRVLYTSVNPKLKRDMVVVTALVAILVGVAFLFAAKHENIRLRFPDFSSVQSVTLFNEKSNMWAHIIVQCAAQGLLLALVFISFILFRNRHLAVAISLLWVLDIAVSVQMNLASTVVCNVPVKAFAQAAEKLPKRFDIPSNKPIGETIGMAPQDLSPMVFNTIIIRHELSHDGYNPFMLKANRKFLASALPDEVVKQPILYATACIQPWSAYMADSASNKVDKYSLYADVDTVDCAASESNAYATIASFTPNEIIANTRAEQPMYITLLQNYYPGWVCKIDGVPTKIIKSNFTFITIKVPPGIHTISYNFEPLFVIPLMWLQIVLWGVVVCVLLGAYVLKRLS